MGYLYLMMVGDLVFEFSQKSNSRAGRHYFIGRAAGHVDAYVEQAELSGCSTFPNSGACLLIDSMARDGKEGIWQLVCRKYR